MAEPVAVVPTEPSNTAHPRVREHPMDMSKLSTAARFFHSVGVFSARHAHMVLLLGLVVGAVFTVGLTSAEMENDVIDLWVKQGGRLDDEMSYIDDNSDTASGSSTELLIVLNGDDEGANTLTRDIMEEFLLVLDEIADIEVTHNGETYDYYEVGTGAAGSSGYPFAQPVHASAIDCFQEAAYDYPRTMTDLVLASTLGSSDVSALLQALIQSANPTDFMELFNPDGYARLTTDWYVSTYDWCLWGQIVYMFNPTADYEAFGWCRPFLFDPASDDSPDTRGFNEFNAAIQPTMDFTKNMLADYILSYNFTDNTLSDYGQTTQCYLWSATLCGILGQTEGCQQENATFTDDCSYREAVIASLDDATMTALLDGWLEATVNTLSGGAGYAALGLSEMPTTPPFTVTVIQDDEEIKDYTTAAGVTAPYCTLWDGSVYGQVIFPPITPRLVLGGVDEDTGDAAALEWLMLMQLESDLAENRGNRGDPMSESTAEEISTKWKREFLDVVYDYSTTETNMYPLSSISFSEILEEASKASAGLLLLGYVLLFAYAGFVFSDGIIPWDPAKRKHSRAGVGLLGVLLVALAISASLGLTAWAGVSFTATAVQVLPFLLLGLGVDDMFIVGHQFNPYSAGSVEDATGAAMAIVGTSISTTSATNCIAFLLGRLTPLPVVVWFSTQAAVAVIFLYFMVLLVYPAALAIDAKRLRRGAWLPCCGGKGSSVGDENSQSKAALVVADADREGEGLLWRFLNAYYIPALSSMVGKALVVATFVAMLVVAIVSLGDLEDGLRTADVIPKDYKEHDFMVKREEYFSFWTFALVLQDLDYPNKQMELLALRDEIVAMDSVPSQDLTWYDGFRQWGLPAEMNTKCDSAHATTEGNCGPVFDCNSYFPGDPALETCGDNGDEQCYPDEVCVSGYECRTVEADWFIFHPDDFYRCMDIWMTFDSQVTTYGGKLQSYEGDDVSQEEYEEFAEWVGWNATLGEGQGTVEKVENPITFSIFSFYTLGTIETDEHLTLLEDTRDITEAYEDSVDLPSFPTGVTFIFYEQYLDLRETLGRNIGLALTGVFVVTTAMLVFTQKQTHTRGRALAISAYASLLNTACCGVIVLLVTGFMPLADIKLNAIPAVSLIMCVGVAVEFTAHYLISFLTAHGTPNERLAIALRERFLAMVDGAFSTFLGVCMMAASDFEFIKKYFFVLYVIIIVSGFFTGLIFLPVLLSLPGIAPSSLHKESTTKEQTAVVPLNA